MPQIINCVDRPNPSPFPLTTTGVTGKTVPAPGDNVVADVTTYGVVVVVVVVVVGILYDIGIESKIHDID